MRDKSTAVPPPSPREVGLDLTDDQRQRIMAVASRMDASPENVLKRAIGSYCARFGGDGPIGEPDETNVVVLSAAVDNQPVKNGDSGD